MKNTYRFSPNGLYVSYENKRGKECAIRDEEHSREIKRRFYEDDPGVTQLVLELV